MDDRIPLSATQAESFMRLAMEQAARAEERGEVPVGCVIVRGDEVIAVGQNRREEDQDPMGHAELAALKAASEVLGSWRLDDCVVVVTLEPCAMCAGAMVHARVAGCIYGCADPKGGFLGTLGDLSQQQGLNHRFPVVSGVLASECSAQLKGFFKRLRQARKRSQERWPSG